MVKDTREHILKKGIELITEKGFHNTGISEILHSASVPKGSFYHYFGSKNEFGREIIRKASAGLLKEAIDRGELKSGQDPEILARFILSGWEGAISQSRVNRKTAPLEEYVTLLFTFLER